MPAGRLVSSSFPFSASCLDKSAFSGVFTGKTKTDVVKTMASAHLPLALAGAEEKAEAWFPLSDQPRATVSLVGVD